MMMHVAAPAYHAAQVTASTEGPKPLPPAKDDGTIESWRNTPLADMTYRIRKNHDMQRVETAYSADLLRDLQQFTKITAVSFEDAVNGAARISRSVIGTLSKDGKGKIVMAPALALLQAKDGAYYATLLAPTPNSQNEAYVFGKTSGPELVDVKSAISSLKAVVGEAGYFDLRDSKTSPRESSPLPA